MQPRKKAPKKAAKAPATPSMKPPRRGVKVRMYRTGLGDCFLLAFPRRATARNARKAFYMLIDCGVYYGTTGGGERIETIVKDIRDSTGGRLDLLVVTHEHWDHVSAFHPQQAQGIFDEEIDLGHLWLAWTEDLELPLARELDSDRRAAKHALLSAMEKMKPLGFGSPSQKLVKDLLDFFGGPADEPVPPGNGPGLGILAAGRKSVMTEKAMEWLRLDYGAGKTRFLHPGEEPLTFDGVPDARVYVLGPPEDRDLIRRLDPEGEEAYPKGMAAAIESSFFATFGVLPERLAPLSQSQEFEEVRSRSLPFDKELQIAREDVEKALNGLPPSRPVPDPPFFQDQYLSLPPWQQIEGDWLDAAGGFALQLDSATNNTSLAFALEIGPPGKGKVLLFPGDAQAGNWLSWFGKVRLKKRGQEERLAGKDMVWSVDGRTVTAEDLLRRTVLYKVGHHGSHNATLRKQGLELMGRPDGRGDFVAFLPVDERVAREVADYGEMPLRSLMKDLAIRTGGRIARNDEGAQPRDQLSTLARIPGAPALRSDFCDNCDEPSRELYFEYTISPP